MNLPALQPREACAAALALLLYGASHREAAAILDHAKVGNDLVSREVSFTVTIRVSPRRKHEATAGCASDAYITALREALGQHHEGSEQ
jgi:hypothetical protein